ncbi:DUF4185 domain-containing protein [Nannocystis sp. SCPEA4]|uniref:DUF4185 domain-containing protein n=1 Tax=Nannocystis sp. SCPEA4 TaxID=2996787 RepID=UPI00226E9D39|nr:DUF4185 domain-containing protein [Nannocystis sp. SCPEA4]
MSRVVCILSVSLVGAGCFADANMSDASAGVGSASADPATTVGSTGDDPVTAGDTSGTAATATGPTTTGEPPGGTTGDPSGGTTGTTDDTGPGPGTTSTPDDPIAETHKIRDLTGPGTSSKQFGVGGTDLGIPVRQPDGKIAYIFGDTFENDGVGGPGWRAPVLLRSEPGDLEAGIEFTGAAGGPYAKQILDYVHNTNGYSTWLPSDAITIGSRMYLHYMVNAGLGNVLWSEIAVSDDNGENWTSTGTSWAGDENNGLRQLWTWERGDDGFVYTLSTAFTRDRGIILHRVPDDKLLDKGAYEPWGYLDGAWGWGNPATEVLTGKFGELCLRRVEDKWVLSWFNAADYDITIKVFDSPISNLYRATTYKPIKGGAWGFENDTTVAQLYGGYIHPDSTLHNLHLIVSQWNTDTDWPYRAMQFVTGVE